MKQRAVVLLLECVLVVFMLTMTVHGTETKDDGEHSVSWHLGAGTTSSVTDMNVSTVLGEQGIGNHTATPLLAELGILYVHGVNATINDTEAPAISSLVNHTTTNQSTNISWTCSEQCNYTLVVYDDAAMTSVVSTITDASFSLSFDVNISNLVNATTYYVNLTVSDSSSNEGYDDSLNFTTDQNPAVGPSEPATGGGGGGTSGVPYEVIPGTIRKQIIEKKCFEDAFIDRLFSRCKIPRNGICDDGENFLMNSECTLEWADVKEGKLFKYMWFSRLVLLLSVFFLARDSKKYPLVISLLILLFVYNGAFVQSGYELDPDTCTDVNFLLNFGYCAMPHQPAIGWLIGFAIIGLLISYFVMVEREVKRRKEKPKKKQEETEKYLNE